MEGIETMIQSQKRESLWNKIRTLFYHIDARPMPVRVYLGPLLIAFSSAISCYRLPGESIWLMVAALLALYPVSRWTLKGAAGASVGLFILYLALGRADPLYNFLFFVSSVTSFFITALALDEWLLVEIEEEKLKSSTKEELSLWKRRFETLSEKHAEEKENFEEALSQKEAELVETKEYIDSLKELVELANGETKRYFDQNRELVQKSVAPASQMELFAEEPKVCQMDDDYIKTVETMATFALSSYTKYKATKSQPVED